MNFPLSFVVFMFVLFSYIHINDQYKKSQDLEIYELEYKGIENLQETCNVKQPVVFNFAPIITKYAPINLDVLSSIEKEDGNTLNVKDTVDYFKVDDGDTIVPSEVPLPFHNTIQLIKTDNSTPHFFTENNHEFIEETGIDGVMLKIGDAFLKPSYTINQTFDIMTAGKGVGLPMRYHTYTRKYIYVSTGRIVVKMAPFKNVKKLNFNKQLLVSPMNCWNPQQRFISHINKIRFLEFDITKGHVLYVPPYWIYSILYDETDTCLLEYNYQTAMNILAHPHGVIHSLKNGIQTAIGSFGGGRADVNKKKGEDNKNGNLRKEETDVDTDDELESVTESNDGNLSNSEYDLSVVTKSTMTTTSD